MQKTPEDYLADLIDAPPLLEEVAQASETRGIPSLGKVCGFFLYQAVRLTRAQRALEMGTGLGYSALWIARALRRGAELLLTDYSSENLRLAGAAITRLRPDLRLEMHACDAMEVLRQQPEASLDVVFVDIQKDRYPEVLQLARTRLRRGGLLAADNWLWGRRVLDTQNREPATEGVRTFNRALLQDAGFVSFFLPLRDGLVLAFRRESP